MSTSGGLVSLNALLFLPTPQQSSDSYPDLAPLCRHYHLFLGIWGNLQDKVEHPRDHRITEWFDLEGTFKDYLVQVPCCG